MAQTEGGRFRFLTAEGEAIPGNTLKVGITSTRARFGRGRINDFAESWAKQCPTHHFALGIGHISDKIEKLAKYLGFEHRCITSG